MKNTEKEKKIKKPSWAGLSVYIAVILILGLAAMFSQELARMVEGPVLCIYVGVLPKYILGLAFILTGIDGIAYGISIYKDISWMGMAASGVQIVLLLIFVFLIFPLSLKEGVPAGSTYNLMRLLIGVMLLFIVWDFAIELKNFQRGKDKSQKSDKTEIL